MLWCLWEGKGEPPRKPTEKEPLECADCPQAYIKLMRSAWVRNPAERPTMELMLAGLKSITDTLFCS